MEIEKLLTKLIITPLESINEAYERCISFFEDNGLIVYRPDYLNENIVGKDITKIFNIYQENDSENNAIQNNHISDNIDLASNIELWKQNKTKLSFFVITTPWNEDNINKILNSFSQTSESSKVYFLSAYPLPDILAFIGKNTPASFFELEAIRNIKNLNDLEFNNESISSYSNTFSKLSQKYFNIEINDNPAQGLKNMQNIIIKYYRNDQEYEMLFDNDIEYFPNYSLLLASMYLSDLLIKNFHGEIFYDKTKDLKEMGIGFATNNFKENSSDLNELNNEQEDIIDMMAHPVNKIFNFFIYGKDSSVINWYYELKYHFSKISS